MSHESHVEDQSEDLEIENQAEVADDELASLEETDATDVSEVDASEAEVEAEAEEMPKAEKKKKKSELISLSKATSLAAKGEQSNVGNVIMINMKDIKEYDNPRNEPENLYAIGFTLIGDPKVEEADIENNQRVSLIHMALSEDIEEVENFVDSIECYENYVYQLISPAGKVVTTGTHYICNEKLKKQESRTGWKIEIHPNAPESIVDLAKNILADGQLSAISVRKAGSKFIVLDGGRRITAILYLHAKSRVCIHSGTADALFGEEIPKIYHPVIMASEMLASGDNFSLACKVNMARKAFSPVQEGQICWDLLQKINPDTGKKYNMQQAAAYLGIPYGTFRNRQALVAPLKKDSNGKRISGLTDIERMKVVRGEMSTTAASKIALGEKVTTKSADGSLSHTRNRGMSLAEMQRLFDETPPKKSERRQAIAECMNQTLEEAAAASDLRIQQQDEADLSKNSSKKTA